MYFIEILYLLASVASVVAMAPQIKQLLVTKQSDELNLATWAVWAGYQVIALAYSVTLHAIPYLIANVAWVSFYVVMLALIIKYRKIQPAVVAETIAVAKSTDI